MQRDRVQDQYPWAREIPLAVVCGVLVVGVGVLQLGRSVANGFAGADWRWPAGDQRNGLAGRDKHGQLMGHPTQGASPTPAASGAEPRPFSRRCTVWQWPLSVRESG